MASLFCCLGIFLGYVIPKAISVITSAKYNRSGLETYMMSQLGDYGFNDIHSHELLAVSYAYNQQQPRLFSKYFNYIHRGYYDVKIGRATGASASAPTFFDP